VNVVESAAVRAERKKVYLQLRGKGLTDKVCSMLLGVSPSYWRWQASADPKFAEKRSKAIATGYTSTVQAVQSIVSTQLRVVVIVLFVGWIRG